MMTFKAQLGPARRRYAEARYSGDLAEDVGLGDAASGGTAHGPVSLRSLGTLAIAASLMLGVGLALSIVTRPAPPPAPAPTPSVAAQATPTTGGASTRTAAGPSVAAGLALRLSRDVEPPRLRLAGWTPRRFPGLKRPVAFPRASMPVSTPTPTPQETPS